MRVFAAVVFGLWVFGLLPGPASAADIEGRHVLLPAKERQVNVTYFRAPGDAPRPSVLLLHGAMGFDAQIANYDRYGSELAAHGMDAYLVYYYSPNDQRSMASGIDVFRARFAAWARLVDDLADDVLADKQSNGKVGLIGFSNGAILAGGAGALDPHINAAVIYYGGAPFPITDQVTRFPPLLILHGDADTIIPVENGKQLASLARQLGGTADLVIYPGERHGFGSWLETKNGADALDRTVTFLAKALDAHSHDRQHRRDNVMHWISIGLALLLALGIIAIGSQYVVNPRAATRSFGLPLPEAGANIAWWLRLKGVRDIAVGLAVLALMAWGTAREAGILILVFAVIPVGDMLTILAAKGSAKIAFGMHGLTAVLMLVAGIPMSMGPP